MADTTESTPSWPEARLLPWHADAAERAKQAWRAGRFPHAVLVQGADGLGKRSFAMWVACAVLCERSTGGVPEGTWIFDDYLDVVLHVFTPETRGRYRLEDLWNDVPKLEAAATG